LLGNELLEHVILEIIDGSSKEIGRV